MGTSFGALFVCYILYHLLNPVIDWMFDRRKSLPKKSEKKDPPHFETY